jgi:hypothetical protein
MERRQFTREFKLDAVRLIKDRGVSDAQAIRPGAPSRSGPRASAGATDPASYSLRLPLSPSSRRSLPDQNGIDHAAHLDELLPIPAVASEARDLPGANPPTLPRQTSATIRSKPARSTPPAAERPRSSSITSISDHLSAVSRSRNAVLQRAALAIVQHLMC